MAIMKSMLRRSIASTSVQMICTFRTRSKFPMHPGCPALDLFQIYTLIGSLAQGMLLGIEIGE